MISKSELSKILNIPENNIKFLYNLWHINGDLYIKDELIENGALKVNFGYVNGDFFCSPKPVEKYIYSVDLFNNAIRIIEEMTFYSTKCYVTHTTKKVTTLKGCPIRVKGVFDCSYNNLSNLDYMPKYVGKYLLGNDNNISYLNNNIKYMNINLYNNNKIHFKKYKYE